MTKKTKLVDYDDLDNQWEDDWDEEESETIDYNEVSEYAKAGLKNPRMIAHAMGLPVQWFIDIHKEEVDLAIERGLAWLALETTEQMRKNAKSGDFQAQKYLLQNIDDTWTDKKETINRDIIDIKGLPSLRDIFNKGITDAREEKQINAIDGEFTEE